MQIEHVCGDEVMPESRRHYLIGLDEAEARLVRRVMMRTTPEQQLRIARLLQAIVTQVLQGVVAEDSRQTAEHV